MARVVRREAAKRDLVRHFVYLAENATLKIARSFKDAAHDTFVALSEAPEMGAPHKIRQGKFAGIRLWRVNGFERYLIAYRPIKEGVAIERVFHAAQDYRRILR